MEFGSGSPGLPWRIFWACGLFLYWSFFIGKQCFSYHLHQPDMSAACMPFCLSQIHSSLKMPRSIRFGWHKAGSTIFTNPAFADRNLFLLWWLSRFVYLLQVRRSLIIGCVQCMHPILFEACPSQVWQIIIVLACSCHTSLVKEMTCSGQIPFQGSSSQESGRLKPLHVTRSSSEAWWAFLPMNLRLESHLGQFWTLLQLQRFLRLPFETMRTL